MFKVVDLKMNLITDEVFATYDEASDWVFANQPVGSVLKRDRYRVSPI